MTSIILLCYWFDSMGNQTPNLAHARPALYRSGYHARVNNGMRCYQWLVILINNINWWDRLIQVRVAKIPLLPLHAYRFCTAIPRLATMPCIGALTQLHAYSFCTTIPRIAAFPWLGGLTPIHAYGPRWFPGSHVCRRRHLLPRDWRSERSLTSTLNFKWP